MVLTTHAQERMQSRRITEEDIQIAVKYGRTFFARGAVIKVIGKKEIERHGDYVDMGHLNGVHVVMSHDGAVLTTYRNRQFRRADFSRPRRKTFRNPSVGIVWLRNCQRLGL